jgi:hypothetical protein
MDDNRFYLGVWAFVVFIILGGGTLIAVHDYMSDKLYMEKGYRRVRVENVGMTWAKP